MSPGLFSNITSSEAGTFCNVATFCKNESSDPSGVGARVSTRTRHGRDRAHTTSGGFSDTSSYREGQTEGLWLSREPDRVYTSVKRKQRPLHFLLTQPFTGCKMWPD